MTPQFFATAGLCSGVVMFVIIVLGCIQLCIDNIWNYDVVVTLGIIMGIHFGALVLFWLVVGVLSGLDAIWNWGILQC